MYLKAEKTIYMASERIVHLRCVLCTVSTASSIEGSKNEIRAEGNYVFSTIMNETNTHYWKQVPWP